MVTNDTVMDEWVQEREFSLSKSASSWWRGRVPRPKASGYNLAKYKSQLNKRRGKEGGGGLQTGQKLVKQPERGYYGRTLAGTVWGEEYLHSPRISHIQAYPQRLSGFQRQNWLTSEQTSGEPLDKLAYNDEIDGLPAMREIEHQLDDEQESRSQGVRYKLGLYPSYEEASSCYITRYPPTYRNDLRGSMTQGVSQYHRIVQPTESYTGYYEAPLAPSILPGILEDVIADSEDDECAALSAVNSLHDHEDSENTKSFFNHEKILVEQNKGQAGVLSPSGGQNDSPQLGTTHEDSLRYHDFVLISEDGWIYTPVIREDSQNLVSESLQEGHGAQLERGFNLQLPCGEIPVGPPADGFYSLIQNPEGVSRFLPVKEYQQEDEGQLITIDDVENHVPYCHSYKQYSRCLKPGVDISRKHASRRPVGSEGNLHDSALLNSLEQFEHQYGLKRNPSYTEYLKNIIETSNSPEDTEVTSTRLLGGSCIDIPAAYYHAKKSEGYGDEERLHVRQPAYSAWHSKSSAVTKTEVGEGMNTIQATGDEMNDFNTYNYRFIKIPGNQANLYGYRGGPFDDPYNLLHNIKKAGSNWKGTRANGSLGMKMKSWPVERATRLPSRHRTSSVQTRQSSTLSNGKQGLTKGPLKFLKTALGDFIYRIISMMLSLLPLAAVMLLIFEFCKPERYSNPQFILSNLWIGNKGLSFCQSRDFGQSWGHHNKFDASCNPCPEKAVCPSTNVFICEPAYIAYFSPLAPPVCLLDTVSLDVAKRLSQEIVSFLKEQRGRVICGEFGNDLYSISTTDYDIDGSLLKLAQEADSDAPSIYSRGKTRFSQGVHSALKCQESLPNVLYYLLLELEKEFSSPDTILCHRSNARTANRTNQEEINLTKDTFDWCWSVLGELKIGVLGEKILFQSADDLTLPLVGYNTGKEIEYHDEIGEGQGSNEGHGDYSVEDEDARKQDIVVSREIKQEDIESKESIPASSQLKSVDENSSEGPSEDNSFTALSSFPENHRTIIKDWFALAKCPQLLTSKGLYDYDHGSGEYHTFGGRVYIE